MKTNKSIFDPVGEIEYSEHALRKTIYLEFLNLEEQVFFLENKGIELDIDQKRLTVTLYISILDGINVPRLYEDLQKIIRNKITSVTNLLFIGFNLKVENVLIAEEFEIKYLEVIDKLAETIQSNTTGVNKVMDDLSTKMKQSLSSLGNTVAKQKDNIVAETSKLTEKATTATKKAVDTVGEQAKKEFDQTSDKLKETSENLKTSLKKTTDNITTSTEEVIEKVKDDFKKTVNTDDVDDVIEVTGEIIENSENQSKKIKNKKNVEK